MPVQLQYIQIKLTGDVLYSQIYCYSDRWRAVFTNLLLLGPVTCCIHKFTVTRTIVWEYVFYVFWKSKKCDFTFFFALLHVFLNYDWEDDKNTKSIAVPQISSKAGKQWRNKVSTEQYCLYSSWQHCLRHYSFIRCIVLWFKNEFSQNLDPAVAPAGLEI